MSDGSCNGVGWSEDKCIKYLECVLFQERDILNVVEDLVEMESLWLVLRVVLWYYRYYRHYRSHDRSGLLCGGG